MYVHIVLWNSQTDTLILGVEELSKMPYLYPFTTDILHRSVSDVCLMYSVFYEDIWQLRGGKVEFGNVRGAVCIFNPEGALTIQGGYPH